MYGCEDLLHVACKSMAAVSDKNGDVINSQYVPDSIIRANLPPGPDLLLYMTLIMLILASKSLSCCFQI